MAKALTHIALYVSDVEISTDFYVDWAGMEVVHARATSGGQEVRWLASPGYEESFVVVLIPGREKPRTTDESNMTHLGVAVETEGEFDALMARAKQEADIHWGYQRHDYPAGTLFAIKDPDGYIVEFSIGQPLGDKAFKQRAVAK